MACFDASMAYYDANSPTMKTYRSYMCTSRDSYVLPDRSRDLRVNRFHYPWNTPGERCFDSKPTHISKLRNILSETISNITKESNLKSGESVELTLEIEMVNDPLTSPTNSLVEVTIIQHKPEESNVTNNHSKTYFDNKNKFKVDRKSCSSECPSQKRRNWFDRVIKRYYNKSPKSNSSEEVYKKNLIQNMTAQPAPITDKSIINTHKNKFINVLPKDITTRNIDYSKGYRRVSPKRTTFKDSSPGKRQPLVKQLSEIFLPTKKHNKNKAIKSALSDLKKEVDHMTSVAEKERKTTKKRKSPPVPKLGKLVSNIFADVMENYNESDSNDKGSVPIHYQSFYEPVVRNKTKKGSINRININSKQMSGLSRSDTCIGTSKSGPVVKPSRSVNDCSQPISFSRKQNIQCQGIGDSRRTSSNKKIKYVKKESRHCLNRNEKGDGKRHHRVSSKKRLRRHKMSKTLNKKYSAIQWNGRTFEVNKEVKIRIEKIIVNELQNLALKEGMECDVSPLPSTNSADSFKAMEKVSSFICELDISDKQLKQVKQHKQKSLIANTSYIIEKKRSCKVLKRIKKKDQRANAEFTKHKAQSSPEQGFENGLRFATTELSASKSVSECRTESNDCTESPMAANDLGVTKDGFEIKYINTNTNKWSDESVAINSSEIIETNESTTQHDKEESTNTDLSGLTFKHLSSGFIKRIESNDSTWNDVPIGTDLITANQCCTEINNVPKRLENENNTRKTTIVKSATSNESDKNIQIELDLKDLETILNEAKHMQDSGKILINAKCKHGKNKNARSREFTGKNSTSYTNHLLVKAAQKLEKFRRSKS